jgi:pilus assembly protein CpaE
MDLEPGRGLTDAIENPSRIDGLFIERAMVRASDKLAILSAEAPISQPMMTDGGAYYQLQEEFRSAFECSVIDLPRAMLIAHPHLMNEVNVAVMVTELTLAAARDSIRILSWMKSNAPQTRVMVVANRVHPTALEISRKDFEQSIERKVDIVIPFDARIGAQAAKLGKTFAEVAKGSKPGLACTAIMDQALGTLEEAGEPDKPSRSLMGKFTDFKSMMPARGKGKKSALQD